jgi:hypothetical protein
MRDCAFAAMFNVCSLSKNCSSARCAVAINAVCRDVCVLRDRTILLNHILQCSFILKL